jgi:energy-coupling factor transporter ATP-binding protein EcfA2
MQVIDRIVSAVGRRIDDSSPMVDARLADGSRVNAIIPPLALDGPHMSIRKFRRDVLSAEDLIRNESPSRTPCSGCLQGCIRARLNVLIAGGTGSGKTTFLNMLSESIPHNERIVTIEDSAELQLRQPHVVRLETRPPNVEGVGAVHQRQLVINSLRMRPDRIILGEVRGEEALDMLQAMNTGHDGSLTTSTRTRPVTRWPESRPWSPWGTPRSASGRALPDRERHRPGHSPVPPFRRKAEGHGHLRDLGHGGRDHHHAGPLHLRARGDGRRRQRARALPPTGVRPSFADRLQAYGVDLGETLFVDPVAVGGKGKLSHGSSLRLSVLRRHRGLRGHGPGGSRRGPLLGGRADDPSASRRGKGAEEAFGKGVQRRSDPDRGASQGGAGGLPAWLEPVAARLPRLADVQLMLEQARSDWSVGTFLLLTGGFALALGTLILVFFGSGWSAWQGQRSGRAFPT